MCQNAKIVSLNISFTDLELLPGCLNRDVLALAGELNFNVGEIRYISMKEEPFKFLLDQWCKREGKKATLNRLSEVLRAIGRLDLVERIDGTIESMFSSFPRSCSIYLPRGPASPAGLKPGSV